MHHIKSWLELFELLYICWQYFWSGLFHYPCFHVPCILPISLLFSRFNDGVVSLHVTRQVSVHDEKSSHFSTGIFTGIVYEIFIFNRVILGEKYFVWVSFSFLFFGHFTRKNTFQTNFSHDIFVIKKTQVVRQLLKISQKHAIW